MTFGGDQQFAQFHIKSSQNCPDRRGDPGQAPGGRRSPGDPDECCVQSLSVSGPQDQMNLVIGHCVDTCCLTQTCA